MIYSVQFAGAAARQYRKLDAFAKRQIVQWGLAWNIRFSLFHRPNAVQDCRPTLEGSQRTRQSIQGSRT